MAKRARITTKSPEVSEAVKVTKPEPKQTTRNDDDEKQTFATEPEPTLGVGGSYVINPKTGKRERA